MKTSVKVVLILSTIIILCSDVAAQTAQSKDKQDQPGITPTSRPNADETFELKIDLRRITRENFEASTSVSTDQSSGLDLQVGVGMASGRIEVLLRNVRGRIRFRGSLDRILEIVDQRRPVATPTPAPK